MIHPEFSSLSQWPETLQKYGPGKVIEALVGLQQMVLILEFPIGELGSTSKALFRPEETLHFPVDYRVPVPQELYRDVAYHHINALLGWQVSAPVIPWKLDENDKGVLRPYWNDVKTMQIYNFQREALAADLFWQKAAVLDYICSVIDRTYNDVLLVNDKTVPEGKVLVDSGVSFVPGTEFVVQQSLIRTVLKDVRINPIIINDLAKLNLNHLLQDPVLCSYLTSEEIGWIMKRVKKVLAAGIVI